MKTSRTNVSGGLFATVLFLGGGFEGIKTAAPERVELGAEFLQFYDIDAVEAFVAVGADVHEVGIAKYFQMLAGSGLTQVRLFGEAASGLLALHEVVQQGLAVRVGEGLER
jgi:hypothetical protein